MKQYNKTQLHPELEFERHIFHRDQFAHYLRWTHVLKLAKINQSILDFGCGNANLLELLYRNKYRPKEYLGIDIRKQTINTLKDQYKNLEYAKFVDLDLCSKEFSIKGDWDIIASFEVIEHIGKQNARQFLSNIKSCMNPNTILLLSTPVYDEKTGAANNYIINGEVCEFEYNELKNLLSEFFIIEDVFGTFASQKDYKPFMNEWQTKMFEHLTKYYDSNLVSNIMAPFFPMQSRNCLWKCKLN